MTEAELLADRQDRNAGPRGSGGWTLDRWVASHHRPGPCGCERRSAVGAGLGIAGHRCAGALRRPLDRPKIRLYSIGDYNSRSNSDARDFVLDFLDDHPDLWWVENGVLPVLSRSTFEGVWRGGNQTGQWNRTTFLERHIRGHGTTAGGEFSQKLGDAFPGAIGPPEAVGALKEGDSPSLLYLLSPRFGGIGDLDDPTRAELGRSVPASRVRTTRTTTSTWTARRRAVPGDDQSAPGRLPRPLA